MSSVTFISMKKTLAHILSDNLAFFMRREGSLYKNPNALGVSAGVAPNTVRNLLHPSKRTVTADKPEGFPQLDNVEKVAKKLGVEVWELFHPNIEQSIRERQFYAAAQSSFTQKPAEETPARHVKNTAIAK